MTQPSFVPISTSDQVRPALRLEVSHGWIPNRPGDKPQKIVGSPGPDQGFAIKLTRHLLDTSLLHPSESKEDVIAGVAALASHRAGSVGRAPSKSDVMVVLGHFGFTEVIDDDQITFRRSLFMGSSHDYFAKRSLVERVGADLLPSGAPTQTI